MNLFGFKMIIYALLLLNLSLKYDHVSSTFDVHSVLQLLYEKIKPLICFEGFFKGVLCGKSSVK